MFLSVIKNLVNELPPSIGTKLAFVDYKYRLGAIYDLYRDASLRQGLDGFSAFVALVRHAQNNVIFYRDFYRLHGFDSSMLKTKSDIKLVPVINKAVLQTYSLEDRCLPKSKGIKSNTGGTTGQPLDFKLDAASYAREWAHIHTIWDKLGYRPSAIKLTLRGKNLGGIPVKYCFNQNEFQVNAYCDFERVMSSLSDILNRYKIEYLHGYPSAVYEFLLSLNTQNIDLLARLKHNLKGVFLGSEYPAPHYRSCIERLVEVPTLSWYGHSEMAVLAYERSEQYLYEPFASYGLAEAVNIDGHTHLVATSLDNYVCPLIRYDTGDLIEPVEELDGVLRSFKISEGRLGEFVVDQRGRKISLTALIFGRHHDIFGFAKFVQVFQPVDGRIDVFVVTDLNISDIEGKFDFSNVLIDICYHKRSIPKKTRLGKVPLLLKDFYETSNSNS